MRYKYLITSEIQSKLNKKNLGTDAIEKLKSQLESGSQLNATSLMKNLLVYKYGNHGGLRYVWFQFIQQDVCIYVLRQIYLHNEYDKKLNDVTKQLWMERHKLTDSEQQELEFEFSKFFKESKKEALPEDFRQYEASRAFDKNRDVIFYEMPLWHDQMKRVSKEYWPFIQLALYVGINSKFEQYDVFLYHRTNDYTLTYRYGDINAIGKSDVYLLQIVKGQEPNWVELFERKYDCKDVTDLQNYSSKCYPDYFTCEYEDWKKVEEDDMANLALSEEEIKILQNVKFPFFVSGLAGSGKSTILYYLYANIYKYMAKKHPDHNLLFLSYNDMLVDKARKQVKAILSLHSSNLGFMEYFDDENNLKHFNKSFVPFRDFLKVAFLDEKSISRFGEEKHITYEIFRKKYLSENKQNGKRLSPSILWSVIRTFIKGRSLKFFTPEDYASDEISRRDRTVDQQVYAEAYRIWDKWYRHYYENGDNWDDLDLVRYALTNGDFQNVFHKYSVIFCDEAQDFTKLEIDLILSLSKHSEYKLSFHPDDKRIPIAFAGDPNQTINPTGFRWAGTKAIFTESFKDCLDTYPELDDPELSKNYRSQLGIVKFANTIQSIRYKYFDATSKDRKLQSVRDDPKGETQDALEYVGFYSYDKHKDVILQNLANANVITSSDGEEGDLYSFPEISDSKVKLNTAIGTKGLEYRAVMLLNFCNDPACRSFQKIIDEEPFSDESECFEVAHFFTKLYIAISRAREQLFIVDTDANYETFWKHFTEHHLWEKLIERFVHGEEKRKLVGHVTLGDIDTLPQRLSESYNAEENGRQAFEKAKGDRSVSLMKRAQSYFLEAGLTALADECDAFIFLYDYDFEKAGDKFLSLNQPDKKTIALNAFWKGQCWRKLINLIDKETNKSDYDQIRLFASQFMVDILSVGSFLQNVADNVEQFQDALASHLDDRSLWIVVLSKLRTNLEVLESVNISISITQNLDNISRYIEWFDNGLAGLRAELFFKHAEFLNNGMDKNNAEFKRDGYDKAIKIWEKVGLTDNNLYYCIAKKLTVQTISEEIVWMNALREQDNILNLYSDDNTIFERLTDEAAGIVFSCLLAKDYSKAVLCPYPKDTQTKWHRLYNQNSAQFLLNVVLENFTPEKFYFLADKTSLEEQCVFYEKLPTDIFDIIFSLRDEDEKGRPYWTYFTSLLKNEHGKRVLKIKNRLAILESLSKIIKSDVEYDKTLASCFLEFMFDDDFNTERTKKFNSTLVTIFGHDVFFKEDFRRTTERNKYFTVYTELNNEEHDMIKNNIRRYVEYYISTSERITFATRNDMKSLLRAYEICVPYQNTSPDYLIICNMYRKCLKDKKLIEIKDWMEQRLLFNQFMDDNMLQKASCAKLYDSFKNKNYDITSFADDFTKEDASMFVSVVNTCDEEPIYEITFISSKLIYKHHLRRDNLKPFCRVNDLVAKLPDAIDTAIDEVLADKNHVNEYAIRILSYTWEALYEHTFVANHYDKLIGNRRLAHLIILLDYLKKRALLHYSHLKQTLFEDKQEEYGIPMSKDYLPAAYPRIEERGTDKSNEKKTANEKVVKTTYTTNPATSNEKQKKSPEKSKTSEPPVFLSHLDAVKIAQLEMAKKLKEMGVPIETICKAAPQLTIEEIVQL